MTSESLNLVSPLDGRYNLKTRETAKYFSENALIFYRAKVEILWLKHLSNLPKISEIKARKDLSLLDDILTNWSLEDAELVKEFEKVTNHDVKSVEYFLQRKLKNHEEFKSWIPFIHFGCTSEDVNNLAYALMLKDNREHVLLPRLKGLNNTLIKMAENYSGLAMLSRTHGQPATPTTLGKEIANFAYRISRQIKQCEQIDYLGKFSGAVGNFNAHMAAYPDVNWEKVSKEFIESLGLVANPYTAQIEPHDFIAEISHNMVRINTILIDMARDIWSYISIGHFKQKMKDNEVGSSTMPHKVNPIDFENAEGNLGIANALFDHFSRKLPISRWQRDLSDSTVLRNLGVAFGHSDLAYQALEKGLSKLEPNEESIKSDLNQNWAVLAEAIQTVMRKFGNDKAYEELKTFTRGKNIDKNLTHSFIETLELPPEIKAGLQALTPEGYIGIARTLATGVDKACHGK